MSIKITIAKTPDMIDEVFKIRYKVFVNEEGYFPENQEERVFDRFDTFPTTSNLVVIKNGTVIGSMRMELDSNIGFSVDEYFDFRSHVPADSKLMHCGMFCLTSEHRNYKIATDIILMACYYAMSKEVTHVLTPTNPLIAMLLKKVGFKAIDEEFEKEYPGSSVPLILDMNDLDDFFISFLEQNQLRDFLHNYDRGFYKEGEYLIHAGEPGTTAFWILEGTVQIKLPGKDKIITRLTEGDIVGELALLTDEVRSADVVAETDVVVMTLSKEVFMTAFLEKPERSLKLVKFMANRAKQTTKLLEDKI